MLFVSLVVSFIEDFKEDFNGKEEILKASHTKEKIREVCEAFSISSFPSHRTQKAYKTKDNNSFSNLRFAARAVCAARDTGCA